jgi:superfamily II DNA or RNA helicase
VNNQRNPEGVAQTGLHDQLISQGLAEVIAGLADPRLAETAPLDPGDAHTATAQYLEILIANTLSRLRGEDSAERQRKLANRLIETLAGELDDDERQRCALANPLQRLLAIHTASPQEPTKRPDTPLSRSTLFTGTRRGPTLASQLLKEIATADHVDVLCSFIRWSGLMLILPALKTLTTTPHADGPRVRIITTSYMGATDPRAVETLRSLPNTEVRVSYDTKQTRLHAKAYVIHRATGFGSAYVGSANLSNAALTEGLEWTTKLSQYELPYLWQQINATFETYWNDNNFEPYTAASADRLTAAVGRELTGNSGASPTTFFDLRPHQFQKEILDVLAAEREVQGKHRHLVIAATGTGKTVIAAFDYGRWSQNFAKRPRLLFIAHREEILQQALDTFRGVLRDQNFGDLLVGGTSPGQREHLFCSIQSYNSRDLRSLPPEHFEYIVVDEFHHAPASSYLPLLDHCRPKILLGLTATPERSDGQSIDDRFGGRFSYEVRLPDAITRRLLSPFQYFGVSDNVDLRDVSWARGGYDLTELSDKYTGNDARAGLVLEKINQFVLDPQRMRAVGFCVSVRHAEFMARFMTRHGVPAIALSAESADEERRSAKDRLVRREINIIFVVDLYNEGVDIPEIDTVLFLRPTESLTVFLQQLGRGLRFHPEKDTLTVLDFIGQQRREFRFASRFRALLTDPTGKLEHEVEQGFPHLPAGCAIQLERVAQDRVLENIRATLNLRRPQLVADLRALGGTLKRPPTLQEALDYLDTSLDELLKRGAWSRLLYEAGQGSAPTDPDEEQLSKGIARQCHVDDTIHLRFLLAHLKSGRTFDELSLFDARRLSMLLVTLWGPAGVSQSCAESLTRLRNNPAAVDDLIQMLEHRLVQSLVRPLPLLPSLAGPLSIHCSYSRDEALVGLGHWTCQSRPDFREGALCLAGPKVDAFFVTLNKTEDEYSPTTMYEDYAINESLFHWQSQSRTTESSPTGQRYIHHRREGYTPLLFVRENRHLASGLTAPYVFLGPADYVSHSGSKPISFTWKLRHPMPARLLRSTSRQAAI